MRLPKVISSPDRVSGRGRIALGWNASLCAAVCIVAISLGSCASPSSGPAPGVHDPGVRGGAPGGGGPLPGLTPDETAFFQEGLSRFIEVDGVKEGLGPRFNSNSCVSCHAQPGAGGSSPTQNPQISVASLDGAHNIVPWFVVPDGPVREARFKLNSDKTPDGGVHALFTISGRSDAPGCSVPQPDFLPAGNPHTGQGGNPNIIFRIPTPVFGAGFIEAIPDEAILANMRANQEERKKWGIVGHPNAHISGTANLSANDGTVTRFGWKAQNKSLLMFSGEAYNVEMGVTNQLFAQERGDTAGCQFNATPEDHINLSAKSNTGTISDIEAFAIFMRLLAPPTPAPDSPSTVRGRTLFKSTGCTGCHTPSLTTGPMISSGSSTTPSAALSHQTANLYSDLVVHNMGEGLADGISQGGAGPDEFRTAPLWGVGQRIFFLHDGRTKDLVEAIEAHKSRGSEANQVIERFNSLTAQEQQDVVDFLRSL
jgi:CxxC motif-containing protein (DUF1111 family)